MTPNTLLALRHELSIKAKNGIDFITAALIVWSAITWVWTLPAAAYNLSVLTFIIGGPMILIARLLSKVYGTTWTVKDNPLQPLGLWLNFAQLFYFPILIFVLLRQPEYFVLTYVVITGAHFFPYAWYYDMKAYAVMAGVITFGAMAVALAAPAQPYLIPLWMCACLVVLLVWLLVGRRREQV